MWGAIEVSFCTEEVPPVLQLFKMNVIFKIDSDGSKEFLQIRYYVFLSNIANL